MTITEVACGTVLRKIVRRPLSAWELKDRNSLVMLALHKGNETVGVGQLICHSCSLRISHIYKFPKCILAPSLIQVNRQRLALPRTQAGGNVLWGTTLVERIRIITYTCKILYCFQSIPMGIILLNLCNFIYRLWSRSQ